MAYRERKNWLEIILNAPIRWWFRRRHVWCPTCRTWRSKKGWCKCPRPTYADLVNSKMPELDRTLHRTFTSASEVYNKLAQQQQSAAQQNQLMRQMSDAARQSIDDQLMNAARWYTNASTTLNVMPPPPPPRTTRERIERTLVPRMASDYTLSVTVEELQDYVKERRERGIVDLYYRRAVQVLNSLASNRVDQRDQRPTNESKPDEGE